MRTSGDILSTSPEVAVLESAMRDVVVNPIDVPSCEQVLNTAPPQSLRARGKDRGDDKKADGERTSGFRGWRTCVELHLSVVAGQ